MMREKRDKRDKPPSGSYICLASPDFLWNLMALANFMRLSLRKGAYAVLSSAAWQEIRGPEKQRVES